MPPFKGKLTDSQINDLVKFLTHAVLRLPGDFPADVAAVACDLDRTLIAEDYVLRPRTRAALAAARDAGR